MRRSSAMVCNDTNAGNYGHHRRTLFPSYAQTHTRNGDPYRLSSPLEKGNRGEFNERPGPHLVPDSILAVTIVPMPNGRPSLRLLLQLSGTHFAALACLLTLWPLALAAMNASFPEDIQQCQHAVISWSGGVPTYTLDVFTTHFNDPTSTPSQSFPFLNGTTFGWTTNFSVGTAVWFKLFDCAGNSAESMSSVNVAAGSTQCMQRWSSWPPPSSYGTSASTPQPTTAPESSATQDRLSSRTIGGIAAAAGVVFLGIVILAIYLSRVIRRRRTTRAPRGM